MTNINPTVLRELIEFYPTQVKYLAVYFDSQRPSPYWSTGRYNNAMNVDDYINFLELAGLHDETQSNERDDNWILVNVETGEVLVLPWQEAEAKLQQQFTDDPDLAFNAEMNAFSIADRMYKA